jgi:hypothetical protein
MGAKSCVLLHRNVVKTWSRLASGFWLHHSLSALETLRLFVGLVSLSLPTESGRAGKPGRDGGGDAHPALPAVRGRWSGSVPNRFHSAAACLSACVQVAWPIRHATSDADSSSPSSSPQFRRDLTAGRIAAARVRSPKDLLCCPHQSWKWSERLCRLPDSRLDNLLQISRPSPEPSPRGAHVHSLHCRQPSGRWSRRGGDCRRWHPLARTTTLDPPAKMEA